MISAYDALNSIEKAGQGLHQDENRLRTIIEGAAVEIARLRSEQAELFKSLARLRLDALRQDRIIGPLDDVERRALAVVQEQKEKLEALSKRREGIQQQLARLRDERTEKSRRVSETAAGIARLEDATRERMADDVAWQAQAAILSGAQSRAEAAEEKALRSETDRDEKSKPYLADTLFMYLWQRGYGTPAYRGGPITRMGDGYVARVVNYEPARQNYFTLTEMPKRLREHAERLKADVEAEAAKLAELEQAALQADGLQDKEAAHHAAQQELDAADKRIAALEAEDAALEQQRLDTFGEDGQRGLAGALHELAASLQREDLRSLLREALETPTQEDERIVERLQKLEGDIERREKEAETARRTAIDLARKRTELERSRDEFRRAGYEWQGGGFSNDKLIGDIIGGMIKGVLTSRDLGDALRSGHRPGRRTSSLPSGSGSLGDLFGGGGGSWGRGGGRAGGGSSGGFGKSGGGGFRTGGGF